MEWQAIFNTASPIIVAVLTGALTYLGLRLKYRVDLKTRAADMQERTSKSHNFLINQLQEERVLFANEAIASRMEMRALQRHVVALEEYIFDLRRHIGGLEQSLRERDVAFKPFIKPIPQRKEVQH